MMSPQRAPPFLPRTPPRYSYAASAAQVATSRATPKSPSLGGQGPVGRGGPRGPGGGKGIEDTGATREGHSGLQCATTQKLGD